MVRIGVESSTLIREGEALAPVERRYQVKVGWLAEGRSDKVTDGKKPNTPEGQIARGGDDCSFGIFAPADNPDGILCFAADLDGVSQGGRGDEASIVAARSIYKGVGQFLQRQGKPLNRDAVGVEIGTTIGLANQQVIKRRNELMRMPGYGGLKENVMATTLSAFALQESEGRLYLHCWNTGDSTVMVYVQTEDRREVLYPVTIPQDLIGKGMADDIDIGAGDLYQSSELQLKIPDIAGRLTIDQLQQIYRDRVEQLVRNMGEDNVGRILSQLTHALGFQDQAVVDYTRVKLPHIGNSFRGSRVKKLRIGAMSDGIENYSDYDEQVAAFRQLGANASAIALLELGKKADADDRSVVVAEVVAREGEEEFTPEERDAILVMGAVARLEIAPEFLGQDELYDYFLGVKIAFGKLPQGSRVRVEMMKNVFGQLGAEGEKLRKAGKRDEEIFEEWLKRVFIPLYRRTAKK